MLKGDIPVHGGGSGAGDVVLDLRVQDLPDPADGHPRLAHLGDQAAQTAHGADQHGVIKGEGDKLPGGHLAPDAQHRAQHYHQQHL